MKEVNLDLPVDRVSPNGIQKLETSGIIEPLRNEVVRLLIEKNFISEPIALEQLHTVTKYEDQEMSEEAFNNISRSFYETSPIFEKHYLALIEYIYRHLKYDFIFQDTPTIRFHFPVPMPKMFFNANGTINCQHTDTMLGHPFEEMNFWIPLTRSRNTSSLLLSTVHDGIVLLREFIKDYKLNDESYHQGSRELFLEKMNKDQDYSMKVKKLTPAIDLELGEVIYFDPSCVHGPDENKESYTRVSFDFRIIPMSDYSKMNRGYQSQGRSKRMFMRGDVFHQGTASQLFGELKDIKSQSPVTTETP